MKRILSKIYSIMQAMGEARYESYKRNPYSRWY
jgi:hypothetical protein